MNTKFHAIAYYDTIPIYIYPTTGDIFFNSRKAAMIAAKSAIRHRVANPESVTQIKIFANYPTSDQPLCVQHALRSRITGEFFNTMK